MSEWWTYRPSDFLLFAPRTYYRLFELYNAEIWPLHIVALFAGVTILLLTRSRIAWRGRLIAAMLAAGWLWIAWAFHWQRYATINWAASYFAVGFAIEAAALLWIGVVRDRLQFDSDQGAAGRTGVAIFVFALVIHPLLTPLAGREWRQLEVFGLTPDPTVVATLGLLLAANRILWVALPIPLLWCLVSGLTLSVMSAADAFVLPAVALVVMLLVVRRRAARQERSN